MNVTRLLFVRHAQSSWNADGRWQGWSNPPLTDEGRRQARAAAGALRGRSVDAVATSDLQRARETAEIFADVLGVGPVEVDEDLREIDVGRWSGLTHKEVLVRHPVEFARWRRGQLDTYPGGESREHHRLRLLSGLERVARRHEGGEVVVVSHGGCLSAVERHLGVHPGRPSTNLTARWLTWRDALAVEGDRFQLVDASLPAPEAR